MSYHSPEETVYGKECPESSIFVPACKLGGGAVSRRHPPYEQQVTRVLAHLTGALERYMQRYPQTPLGACLEAAEDLVTILEEWRLALTDALPMNDDEGPSR